MTVEPAVLPQCFTCHGITAEHLCRPGYRLRHLPLLPCASHGTHRSRQVEAFPTPPSHDAVGFMGPDGHGVQAEAGTGPKTYRVAPSCATCHAQNFCITCHVNAPETPTDPGARSGPPVTGHSGEARGTGHASAGQLRPDDMERTRKKNAVPARPATRRRVARLPCHARRGRWRRCTPAGPDAARAPRSSEAARPATWRISAPSTHRSPAAIRSRARAATRGRSASIVIAGRRSERRSTTRRHSWSGTPRRRIRARRTAATAIIRAHSARPAICSPESAAPTRPLQAGYHDVFPGFLLNHGQAARQSLESCTSCHVEKDCLTCHSALYGRGFNPHGPGFNADKLRSKNPQMCTACHGLNVPGGN